MTRKQSTTVERVLTQKQVSDTYGVAQGTLKAWRHEDRGPRSFLRGGKVVYRETEVHHYFEAEEAASTRGGGR